MRRVLVPLGVLFLVAACSDTTVIPGVAQGAGAGGEAGSGASASGGAAASGGGSATGGDAGVMGSGANGGTAGVGGVAGAAGAGGVAAVGGVAGVSGLAGAAGAGGVGATGGASAGVGGGSSGTGAVSGVASLTELKTSLPFGLDPVFASATTAYTVHATWLSQRARVFARTNPATANLTVNGNPATTGGWSEPVSLDPGGNPIGVAVDAPGLSGGAYGISVDTTNTPSQVHYLKASTPTQSGRFGGAVAAAGSWMAVSAWAEGRVYMFQRVGAAWQSAGILSIDADMDRFGISLAMTEDVLVIGAPHEGGNGAGVGSTPNNALFRAGAAYVFRRDQNTWVQEAYLKASNPQASALMGSSVCTTGDVIVVGAPGESNSLGNQTDGAMTSSGAAYAFTWDGSNWQGPQRIKASNAGTDDQFGYSVGCFGDRVVVGAPYESSPNVASPGLDTASKAGAVYVFSRAGGAFSEQALVKAANLDAGDEFGTSVATTGAHFVVGAGKERSRGPNQPDDNSVVAAGAAYVFSWSGSQQSYLKAGNATSSDVFGIHVAAFEDLVAVSATGEERTAGGINPTGGTFAASLSGAVYVFRVSDSSQLAYIKASLPATGDIFGGGVALGPDFLVVGAESEDGTDSGVNSAPGPVTSGFNSGAAYVFH